MNDIKFFKGLRMKHKNFIVFLLAIIFVIPPSLVNANAYCSLRDPVAAIQYLYPDSTSHKSIVKMVDQDIRKSLKEILPFTLHFNELGKHTLYVALVEDKPNGFIHARTELTDWGLVEVAWALNLDLSINNFYIQRCRISECNDENIGYLRDILEGKSFQEILAMYSSNDKNFNYKLDNQTDKVRAFTLSIIRSALKTIVVTEKVWKKDIENINLMALANKYFPEASVIKKHKSKFTNDDLNILYTSYGEDENYLQRDSVNSLLVSNKNGERLAYIVNAAWEIDGGSGQFVWLISPQANVLAIEPKFGWPSEDMRASFNAVVGQNIRAASDCSTLAEVTASELFFLSGINQ